jgi:hypothetical protein
MMTRTQDQVLSDIDHFQPTDDGNWLRLDVLLAELWEEKISMSCLPTLFRVFERYPDEDGAGVFWSIVHGLEATDLDYEAALRDSISRQPSDMGRIMLRRIEKAKES